MNRYLHIGYGPLGKRVVSDIPLRGGQVVGIVDANRDALSDAKGAVYSNLSEFRDWGSVDTATVTTRSALPACADLFRLLLRHGVNVVSSCEELAYPWLRHRDLAIELDTLAKCNGSRLLGTGINPGFLMDLLPGTVLLVCTELESIRVTRRQDATQRGAQFQKKIGAGLPLEEFKERWAARTIGHVGLGESLHLLADLAGFKIETWSEESEAIVGDKGIARGIRQTALGKAGKRVLIELVFEAALDLNEPTDRVELRGTPPLELVCKGGVPGDIGTSALLLSMADRIRFAPHGLHTVATLPLCDPNAHPTH